MVKRERANYLIQSVSHAIDVLEELAKENREVGVTELSNRLKLHKNNVFRLLASLELRGFVQQNKTTEDYKLGVRCLQLGQAYLFQNEISEVARTILTETSGKIGETCSFAMIQNNYVMYPVSIESKRPVRVPARKGVSFMAKSCVAGRLLLSQCSDEELKSWLDTDTPQDAAIKNQLAELRTLGYAVDRGAAETDVCTVTAVVWGLGQRLLGAVEILTPQYRANMDQTLSAARDAAAKLSKAFGGSTSLSASIEKEFIANGKERQETEKRA